MIGSLLFFDAVLVPRVGSGVVYMYEDVGHVFPFASVTKPIVAQLMLVAVEQGLISLDDPTGPEGSTVRHLLAHASGLSSEGHRPVTAPERRRIYSNEGFNILGEVIGATTGVGITQWVRETVFGPLGMATANILGSPTRTGVANASNVNLFGTELTRPALLGGPLAALAALSQFPALADVVPGYGRLSPCPWGLGLEVRSEKSPHWTAPDASPRTIGCFGQSGSLVWMDRDLRASAAFVGTEPLGLWHHDNWSVLSAELSRLAREHA